MCGCLEQQVADTVPAGVRMDADVPQGCEIVASLSMYTPGVLWAKTAPPRRLSPSGEYAAMIVQFARSHCLAQRVGGSSWS